MWERKEIKGQRAKKAKLDPQVEIKAKSRKSDLIIEELLEDMNFCHGGWYKESRMTDC